MKSFLTALQFLTIFPVMIKSGGDGKDSGKSLLCFPLIGLLIGILLSATAFLFSSIPLFIRAFFILTLSVVITGGLHIDGLADTLDGIYGGQTKERSLEIMRDSHIGAFGVIGIVMLLLFKFSLFVSYPAEDLWKVLIMMSLFSRWSMVLVCNIAPYAREDGKATGFIEHANKRDLYIGGIITLVIFILLMQLKGVIIFLFSVLAVLIFLYYIKEKIGGMTGDTIGATNELAEVSVIFLAIAVL